MVSAESMLHELLPRCAVERRKRDGQGLEAVAVVGAATHWELSSDGFWEGIKSEIAADTETEDAYRKRRACRERNNRTCQETQ